MSGRCTKVVIKCSSPPGVHQELVQLVPDLVHVLRLVHHEMLYLNVLRGRGVRVSCYFGKMDGAALSTLYHPSAHNRKESSCLSADMYGKLKHCLSDEANGSDGRSDTH